MLPIVFNIIIILFFPFLFLGWIHRVKAMWSGRVGVPFLQPWWDFIKLLHKERVISHSASWIFQISPVLIAAALMTGVLVLPMVNKSTLISFDGDFLVFAYLYSLAKYFQILMALDTGSSFEGMGASREASYTALIEPAFFIIIASVAYVSGFRSFQQVVMLLDIKTQWVLAVNILIVLALFIMMIVEGCRVPVDDPNTHLELTMIHEVMILDNSGPDLALLQYAAGLKMLMPGILIANFLIPLELGLVLNLILFISFLFMEATLIGLIESLMARIRLKLIPEFVLMMFSFALIVLAMLIIYQGGIV